VVLWDLGGSISFQQFWKCQKLMMVVFGCEILFYKLKLGVLCLSVSGIIDSLLKCSPLEINFSGYCL